MLVRNVYLHILLIDTFCVVTGNTQLINQDYKCSRKILFLHSQLCAASSDEACCMHVKNDIGPITKNGHTSEVDPQFT